MTGDDSSEESDCGSDRSFIIDGLMVKLLGSAEQVDPQVEEEYLPHGWVTLQDHLGAKTSLPGDGPDTGAGEKKAMTAGLLETDGLGTGSCLWGRQTSFLTLICCRDSAHCHSCSHSSAMVF